MAFYSTSLQTRILNDSIEEFLTAVVQGEHEKIEFRGYYSKFLEKQSRKRRSSKRGHLRRLRSMALRTLREKHPSWYKEVEPYAFDLDESTQEARQARLFLIRFALLEEFRESKKPQSQNFWWDSFKSNIKSFGRSVAHLKDRVFHKNKHVTA